MKKKFKKKGRIVFVSVFALVLLLSCSLPVFADVTVDHSDPEETQDAIQWNEVTAQCTTSFENNGFIQRVLTGYDLTNGVDDVITSGLTENNYYAVKYIYLYYDVLVKDTYKIYHGAIAPLLRFICNIDDLISVSTTSLGTVLGIEVYDTELNSTCSTAYADRFTRPGGTGAQVNIYHYFLAEQDVAQYTTDRFDISTRLRITVKYDIDTYLTNQGFGQNRMLQNVLTAVDTIASANNVCAVSNTASEGSFSAYASQDTYQSQLLHLDHKLYELSETTNDIYHELFSTHTRLISMHTTLSEMLTVLSNFASTNHTDLQAIWARLTNMYGNDEALRLLLTRQLEQINYEAYSDLASAENEHASREDIALSMVESIAPDVESEVAVLQSLDVSSFWEANQRGATFWKLLLNNFFDGEVLGVIASFLSIIVIILLIKFVLRV